MARPKIVIEAVKVRRLAEIGCNSVEIAHVYGVAPSTITRRFAKELTKGNTELRQKLRRKQLSIAMKGNVTMLIWLGKQLLDQSDRSETLTTITQTVFSYDRAIAGITRRSEGDRGTPSTNESDRDGKKVGQELHGGDNVSSGG